MNKELVVISDIHVHPWKAFSDGSGLNNSRLRRTLLVLKKSLQEARDRDAYWICAGDIIHSTGYALHEVSGPLLDVLEQYNDVEKYAVYGNHDARSQGGEIQLEETFWNTLQKTCQNLIVLDHGYQVTEEGICIWGSGAQNDTQLVESMVGDEFCDIGIFHQMVSGASFPSGMVTDQGLDPDFLREHFRFSIVGDIHKPHLDIDDDGRVILIPGSPEQHNFGDSGERGYWVVTLENGNEGWIPVDFEMVESESPKFLTVDDPSEVKNDGNYYRVKGSSGDLPENAVAVQSSPDVVETRDLLEGAQNKSDILQRWLEINPPEGKFTDRYLGTGLDILKRQDDIVPRDARIRRVEGENFFSYESFEYDVRDGVHLIVGRSNDFSSNGAGKSSLVESIFWCLFGKTTKGVSAADVIRWGESSCRVRVEIELDEKELVVERSRTEHSINLEVYIDGKEVTAETNTALSEKLEGIIGFTPDLFKALGYFSQEDLTLLSRSTDAELKGILADLRGLSAYQDAADEAGELSREALDECNKYASKVDTLTEEIERDHTSLQEEAKNKKVWDKKHEKKVEELETNVTQAEKTLEEVEKKQEERIHRIEARTERLLKQAEEKRSALIEKAKNKHLEDFESTFQKKYQKNKEELQEVLQELGDRATLDCDIIQEKEEEKKDEIRELKTEFRSLRSSLKQAEKESTKAFDEAQSIKKKLENLDDSQEEEKTCPTCGQALSSHESFNNVQQDLERKLDDYKKQLETAHEKQHGYEQACEDTNKALEEAQETLESIQVVVQLLEKRDTLQDKIERLEEKKNNAEETAEAKAENDAERWIRKRQNHITNRTGRAKRTLDKQISATESRLKDARTSLKNEREKENPHSISLKRIQNSIEERKKNRWRAHRRAREAEVQSDIYSYWQNGFGKTGLQSLLLEDLASLFNQNRSEIFPVLTRGKYDVQMSATSRTQSGEIREKAEYRVFQDGKEVPYANLSGGQRRRVDLGVLLTTTLAASRAHGVPGSLGIMVLDEVASYLDDDGAEALAETLQSYSPDVVPAIFVVSQDRSHKALYESTVFVEQDENGVSRIQKG